MRAVTIISTSLSLLTFAGMTSVSVGAYNKHLDDITIADFSRKQECLAQNIYHEARSESELGMRAVAYVTMNRAHSDKYPSDICDVVYQAVTNDAGVPLRNKCQFSWYCDGKSDEIVDNEAYAEAQYVASVVLNTYGYSFDPTMGATMYHTYEVDPFWKNSFDKTTQIENHIFYR